MNEENKELTKSELTEEELRGVVGGYKKWDALLEYLLATAPSYPGVIDLVTVVKNKDWNKAIDLAAKIGKLGSKQFPDFNKYFAP